MVVKTRNKLNQINKQIRNIPKDNNIYKVLIQLILNNLGTETEDYKFNKFIDVYSKNESEIVTVAGWAIARQHPRGHSGTVFVTIEDETSDVQLIIWPKIFNEFKSIIRNPLMLIKGRISQWDSSISIEVDSIDKISVDTDLPPVHDWH